MKVWGISLGRNRSIVAAPNQKAAAAALDISLYLFRQYASDTGNDEELALATAEPGQVFMQSLRPYEDATWRKVDRHCV